MVREGNEASAPHRSSGKVHVPVLVTVSAGIAITAAAFLGTYRLERRRLRSEFRERASRPAAAIQQTIEVYAEDVESVARLYAASEHVERDEFRAFVKGILSKRLAVQALLWVRRVRSSEREAFEAGGRAYRPDFRLSRGDADEHAIPEGEHEEYWPVWYVEPSQSDERILGLDLKAHSGFGQALAHAGDTGRLVATEPVTLGDSPGPEAMVAFVRAIYLKEQPRLATVELRRDQVLGFVVGVFRVGDLVREAVGTNGLSGLRLWIFEETGRVSGPALFSSAADQAPPAGASTGERFAHRTQSPFTIRPLSLAGREWRCVFTPAKGYSPLYRAWRAWAVLVVGLVLTVLSTAFVRTLAGRAVWAEGVVATRTAELHEANEQLRKEVAERMRHESALEGSEARHRLLLQTMNEGFSILDADGRMTYANDGLCRILGYSADELLGHSPADFLDEPNRAILREQLARRRTGESASYELAWTTKDGQRVHTIVSPRAVLNADGSYSHTFAVLTDITRLKHAQDELAQAMAELQRSNAELESFAYVASHDLQEPLRKIRAFGDRLVAKAADALDPKSRDYLGRMQNAAERMQELIDGLLTFSRVTTKGQPFVRVDLAEVAREVASDLEVRIEELGARVEIGDLPSLDADPLQMRQLLQNLIGNALKFHRPDETPRVRVRGEIISAPVGKDARIAAGRSVYRLTVQDNGIGFDMKYTERIFGMFQRLHGRSEYEGTGVGLAVCRKIADRHSGTIAAHSAPGEGATFTVTLPARRTPGGVDE